MYLDKMRELIEEMGQAVLGLEGLEYKAHRMAQAGYMDVDVEDQMLRVRVGHLTEGALGAARRVLTAEIEDLEDRMLEFGQEG